MRREDLTLTVDDAEADSDGPDGPTLVIEFDGPAETAAGRLEGVEGESLGADQIDVSFRFTTAVDAEDAAGVLGVTDRVTGDFLLEVNADASDVLSFVRTARRREERDEGDGQYAVVLVAGDDQVATYEKATFLVYNRDGDLLREKSLIPGGVEL
jgi:hypothetical protein